MTLLSVLKYVAIVATVGFLGWFFSPVLVYILLAICISLAGRPVMNLMLKIQYKHQHIPRGLAAMITILFIWFLLFTAASLFIPLVIQEIAILSRIDTRLLLENFSEPINFLQKMYGYYAGMTHETLSVNEIITTKLTQTFSMSKVLGIISLITSALGNILIAIFSVTFISFFLLKDQNLMLRFLVLLFPKEREPEVLRACDTVKNLLGRYFLGIVLQSFLIFILLSIGLSIIGIEFSHVALIAVFAAVINVIPYIGPLIGTGFGVIVGALVSLGTHNQSELLVLVLFILVVFLTVQLIDNFIFQPIIFSKTVKAHPLEIFLVILMAGYIGGILGMIVGVPVYTVLRVVAKEFFPQYRFVRKFTNQI
jgi:predicted PurR-regulated permease PerM